MTIDDLLSRLDEVRRCGRGWKARCPAHQDHTPSLSIHEGDIGILLKCWAGCSVEEIVAAMGLRMGDLFYDSALSQDERRSPTQHRKPRPFDWRDYADDLAREADGLWLRGTEVLEHACGLDTHNWSDADIDDAMEAVSRARVDLVRAVCFDRLAVNVRTYGLKKEKDHERRHSAA